MRRDKGVTYLWFVSDTHLNTAVPHDVQLRGGDRTWKTSHTVEIILIGTLLRFHS